jgi:outer membrane protein assembly factor BamE (lipoprotein component of BamABCDE complex)
MRVSDVMVVVAMMGALAGCASYERTRGVEASWRDPAVPAPVVGTTTQSEILEALGPPSQVIGLRDQTVFYYLREQDKGRGGIFIVYNWLKEDVRFDRAIFFFDADGVLRDYGLSKAPQAAAR